MTGSPRFFIVTCIALPLLYSREVPIVPSALSLSHAFAFQPMVPFWHSC